MAVKDAAAESGVPHQRFIRQLLERARRAVAMLLDRLNPEPGRVKSWQEEHGEKRRTSSRP